MYSNLNILTRVLYLPHYAEFCLYPVDFFPSILREIFIVGGNLLCPFFLDSYRINFKEDFKNLKFTKREEKSLVRMH